MRAAIALADEAVRSGQGGPFGCVIMRQGEIVGRGHNRVLAGHDPTAHAEIVAIRDACARLGRFHLDDCELYASCEPCPMCLGAIYWAHIPVVRFGNTRADAAAIGFDDDHIYRQIELPAGRRAITMTPLLRAEARASFETWAARPDKQRY